MPQVDLSRAEFRDDGPNICKDYLIGEHGCGFSKKTGRKCWYSHDLTKAALPLHDKNALREHFILAEAWYNKTKTYDELIATIELEETWKRGAITEGEYAKRSTSMLPEHMIALMQWHHRRENSAKTVLEHFRQTGKIEEDTGKGETPVIDLSGLPGADILRLCGVEKPFGKQRERKAIAKSRDLATETCDKLDGSETEEEWSEQGGVRLSFSFYHFRRCW
ncbi:MAG: hypothetical protein Q9196_000708 [Gyalolechia fulgens]